MISFPKRIGLTAKRNKKDVFSVIHYEIMEAVALLRGNLFILIAFSLSKSEYLSS